MIKKPLDIFDVQDKLQMPDVLAVALLAILSNNDKQRNNCLTAIQLIGKFKTDMENGNQSLPLQASNHCEFISGIKATIIELTKSRLAATTDEFTTNSLYVLCFAATSIMDLFAVDALRLPAVLILENALSSLDAALYWLSANQVKAGVQ